MRNKSNFKSRLIKRNLHEFRNEPIMALEFSKILRGGTETSQEMCEYTYIHLHQVAYKPQPTIHMRSRGILFHKKPTLIGGKNSGDLAFLVIKYHIRL
jgi:hypothetical protein